LKKLNPHNELNHNRFCPVTNLYSAELISPANSFSSFSNSLAAAALELSPRDDWHAALN